ncbi:proteasome assembly chaperone 3 [Lingula anatina]|uniref:Proteasome assembly chaperone 3 n=1 Tax=Lingula anatina TaxID=7574 RepID=A0A1S3KEC3_LINAN|nr:proteasome assembly chaperone 3 [Lingula anatina]|eukprot:XP_013420591.1 proteasome assembly chaperone 3 [Lingula anatina]
MNFKMAAPMQSLRPSKQVAFKINGHQTDISCTDFQNRLFLVITQLQKIGTLIHLSKDVVMEQGPTHVYTTKVLLGKDEEHLNLLARRLAERIPINKPILLSLALKDTSIITLKAIEQLIVDNQMWEVR